MDQFLAWCVQLFQMMLSLLSQMKIASGVSVLTLLVALFVLAAVINAFLLRSH